ncbi:hypothetical protein E4O92_14780 [Massilia horti]|uniref:Transposase IS30-like HTH domain-containing protein n=1 Tax=Massilia horti TaxID=2562153 RepID=A0A4Y9SX25_9BURK|nr:hypothetical protein E4O92_14780 [Massilia horti]
MAQKPRIYYTDTQKALMWERWRQGESLQKIAQLSEELRRSAFGSVDARRKSVCAARQTAECFEQGV